MSQRVYFGYNGSIKVATSKPGYDAETAALPNLNFAAGDNLVCAAYLADTTDGNYVSFGRTFAVIPTVNWLVYRPSRGGYCTPFVRIIYGEYGTQKQGVEISVSTTGFSITRYESDYTTVRYLVTWNP